MSERESAHSDRVGNSLVRHTKHAKILAYAFETFIVMRCKPLNAIDILKKSEKLTGQEGFTKGPKNAFKASIAPRPCQVFQPENSGSYGALRGIEIPPKTPT
jgi:hypothetical protein